MYKYIYLLGFVAATILSFPFSAFASLTIDPASGTDGLFSVERTAGEGWWFYDTTGAPGNTLSPAYKDPCGSFASNIWNCDLTGAGPDAGSSGTDYNEVYGSYFVISSEVNCENKTKDECVALSPAYVLSYDYIEPTPTPTSTPTTTLQTIYDVNRDFAFLIAFFLTGFFGMIWLFKRKQ